MNNPENPYSYITDDIVFRILTRRDYSRYDLTTPRGLVNDAIGQRDETINEK